MELSSTSHSGASGDLSTILGDYQLPTGISTKKTKTLDEQSGQDIVTLSQEGQKLARSHSSSEKNSNTRVGTKAAENLDNQQIQELQELKQRDAEVRTHEQAHLAAAGQYSRGGPSFTYEKGPDGVSYAVGGEVEVDLSKERTPEATISKMQTIKRAALAPASPSAADRSIAAYASNMESEARQEVLVQRQEKLLHADTAQNPAVGQMAPNEKQKFRNTPLFPPQNTVRTMIASYQRIAGY